jgi:uncharacterized protein (TIGR00251 family)
MNGQLDIKHSNGKTVLGVKVVPGSSRTTVTGFWNGMLKVKVSSPPEKGKANEALAEFLAGKLGIRARDISIVSGQTNPVKHLEIAGNFAQSVFEALAGK